jgi:hypothetical protein
MFLPVITIFNPSTIKTINDREFTYLLVECQICLLSRHKPDFWVNFYRISSCPTKYNIFVVFSGCHGGLWTTDCGEKPALNGESRQALRAFKRAKTAKGLWHTHAL